MDIISNPIINSHRKFNRRRNVSSDEKIQNNNKLKKYVQLNGLGRDFIFHLQPNNHNLIHGNDFVHLIRYRNYSEILPDGHVRGKLTCFYHGYVQHAAVTGTGSKSSTQQQSKKQYGKDNNNNNGVKYGKVALDLCKGLVRPYFNYFPYS